VTGKKPTSLVPTSPLQAGEHARGEIEDGSSTTTSSVPPVTLPVRRPMAQVTRITLFEREVREKLSRAALTLLLARLDVLSEGQRTHRAGRDLYFGSTMMTADLARLTDVLRDNPDGGTAERLLKLLQSDDEARLRLQGIAVNEAHRIACVPLKAIETHLALRAGGDKVYVDIDVEAEF